MCCKKRSCIPGPWVRLAAWAPRTAALRGLTAWPQGRAPELPGQLLGGGHPALLQTHLTVDTVNMIAVYVLVVYVLAVQLLALYILAV